MNEIDVSQLAKESLSKQTFPASNAADFRVFFDQEVHAAISAHASEDTSIEICGVVVGEWHTDDDGPFAKISNFIRCDDAASKNTEVTFTHQSWSQINDEMDSKYSDKRIIGWYHSHPDFGIFLSDRDMFIQQHFFSGPGQIAYVVDPVRKLEGVFEWRAGKAELMQRYWAGNRVIPVDAASSEKSVRPSRSESVGAALAAETNPDAVVPMTEGESAFSLLTMLLSGLCLFMLGMLAGNWKAGVEQTRLAEGAIAHYGLWNLLQIGRSDQLDLMHRNVDSVFKAVSELSEEQTGKLDGDERKDVYTKFHAIRKELADTRDNLKKMQELYNVPPEHREKVHEAIIAHIGDLQGFRLRERLPIPAPEGGMEELTERVAEYLQKKMDAAKAAQDEKKSGQAPDEQNDTDSPDTKSDKISANKSSVGDPLPNPVVSPGEVFGDSASDSKPDVDKPPAATESTAPAVDE